MNREQLIEYAAAGIEHEVADPDTARRVAEAVLAAVPPHPLDDPEQQKSIRKAENALKYIVRSASVCDACGRLLSEEGCEYRREWSRKVHTVVGGMQSRHRS
jgi:uncharacterized protein involved in type VI secretion and phage assembly